MIKKVLMLTITAIFALGTPGVPFAATTICTVDSVEGYDEDNDKVTTTCEEPYEFKAGDNVYVTISNQSVTYYRDSDSDGYGDPDSPYVAISQLSGFVVNNNDCVDYDPSIHPGATEICGDNIDQNCDGLDTVCEPDSDLAYEIQKLYIGYLGRAADKAGLDYWVNGIATGVIAMEQLRANLTNEQPEYTNIYGGLTRRQVASQIYRNLFEREPDAEGLEYWVNGGGSIVNADKLIVAFINGAGIADRLVLDNKTTEAMEETENEPTGCDSNHLNLCTAGGSCFTAGGYWLNNTCRSYQEVEFGTIVSPTGQIWMDRNLGASRVAISIDDREAYGDLYQWGRGSDGHEEKESWITDQQSLSDNPDNSLFITHYEDWRELPNSNLWQGESGINNPCPTGFRLPTWQEIDAELDSWSTKDSNGAYDSPLKLPAAGIRRGLNGEKIWEGEYGYYWSSSEFGGMKSYVMVFHNDYAIRGYSHRASGYSVRCIK